MPYHIHDNVVVIKTNSDYNIPDLDFDGDTVEVDMKESKDHSRRLNKVVLRTHRKHEALSTQFRKQDTNQRYGFQGKDKRRRNDRRK